MSTGPNPKRLCLQKMEEKASNAPPQAEPQANGKNACTVHYLRRDSNRLRLYQIDGTSAPSSDQPVASRQDGMEGASASASDQPVVSGQDGIERASASSFDQPVSPGQDALVGDWVEGVAT